MPTIEGRYLLDTNVLIYASLGNDPRCEQARRAIEQGRRPDREAFVSICRGDRRLACRFLREIDDRRAARRHEPALSGSAARALDTVRPSTGGGGIFLIFRYFISGRSKTPL